MLRGTSKTYPHKKGFENDYSRITEVRQTRGGTMTNYQAAPHNRHRGHNQKDGASGRRYRPICEPTGFWGLAGFTPTAPNEWIYAWPEVVGCPTFAVIETDVCIIAGFRDDIIRIFIDIPHTNVKDYLDDLILEIYRHDAEIEWREPGDEEADPPAWMGGDQC